MEEREAGAGSIERIHRLKDAAQRLGVSQVTLHRKLAAGELRAVRVSSGLRGIRESEIVRFIDSLEEAPPDRGRVAAALASPRHGRNGRAEA